MKICKLTDSRGRTKGNTAWGEGVTHTALPAGNAECSNQVVHGYISPEVAVFCDPIHGKYGAEAQLWLAEMDVTGCDGLKVWGKSCTTIKRIQPLPTMTTERRVEIAIRTAMFFYHEPKWVAWAEKWLSGEDKTARSAWVEKWLSGEDKTARSAWVAWVEAWAEWAARAAHAVWAVEEEWVAWAEEDAAAAVMAAAAVAADKKGFNIGLHLLIASKAAATYRVIEG